MAASSTGVTWVNSGLAVLDKQNAVAPVRPRRHRGIAGRARAGGDVITNHPTSSSGYEEAARAGAAPPLTGPRHGPPTSNARPRLKQQTLRDRAASTNSRLHSPSSTPTTLDCAANSLAIRIERNTFRGESMSA
jgi:hypothetical protein